MRSQLQPYFELNTSAASCIDLKTNLVHQIFQTKRLKCVNCGADLERLFRGDPSHKGAIALLFDNLLGVLICTNYIYKCKIKTCATKHLHGYHIDANGNGNKNFESKDQTTAWHITASTFYGYNLFDEFEQLSFNYGIGFESFCDIFNKRHEKQMSTQQELLGNTSIGRRTDGNISLQASHFQEAYFMYKMQHCHEIYFKEQFSIFIEDKKSAMQKKKEQVMVPPQSNKQNENENDNKNDEKKNDEPKKHSMYIYI